MFPLLIYLRWPLESSLFKVGLVGMAFFILLLSFGLHFFPPSFLLSFFFLFLSLSVFVSLRLCISDLSSFFFFFSSYFLSVFFSIFHLSIFYYYFFSFFFSIVCFSGGVRGKEERRVS